MALLGHESGHAMTEAEWNASTDPAPMLRFLRDTGRLSDRRLRRFAVACCRQAWHLFSDERDRRAVEVAEAYLDGSATGHELQAAWSAVWDSSGYRTWQNRAASMA